MTLSHANRQKAYRRRKREALYTDGCNANVMLMNALQELNDLKALVGSLRDEIRSVTRFLRDIPPHPPSIKNLPSEDEESSKIQGKGKTSKILNPFPDSSFTASANGAARGFFGDPEKAAAAFARKRLSNGRD